MGDRIFAEYEIINVQKDGGKGSHGGWNKIKGVKVGNYVYSQVSKTSLRPN